MIGKVTSSRDVTFPIINAAAQMTPGALRLEALLKDYVADDLPEALIKFAGIRRNAVAGLLRFAAPPGKAFVLTRVTVHFRDGDLPKERLLC